MGNPTGFMNVERAMPADGYPTYPCARALPANQPGVTPGHDRQAARVLHS